MDDISLEGGVEVTRVSKDFEESANPFLGFVLSLSLNINGQVLVIKMTQQPIEEF
jgi:hypothetical protein